jgi:hypothetical protein
MCLVIFVTQTRWYDFFDESLHVMERLRKRQSLLVSPIRGRESCLEWPQTADGLHHNIIILQCHQQKARLPTGSPLLATGDRRFRTTPRSYAALATSNHGRDEWNQPLSSPH